MNVEAQTETLMAIARNIREMARTISSRGEALQTNLFGAEPRDVAGNPPSIAETVEGVLREALSVINDADAQFVRTITRIGDDRINKEYPQKAAYR